MDFMTYLQDFLTKAVDAAMVVGIILFIAGVRWVVEGFSKLKTSDGFWRLMALCLGVACAFIKLDYAHSFLSELLDLLGKAFAYGGSATLFYQLYRVAAKKLFPPEEKVAAPAPPDQGIVG